MTTLFARLPEFLIEEESAQATRSSASRTPWASSHAADASRCRNFRSMGSILGLIEDQPRSFLKEIEFHEHRRRPRANRNRDCTSRACGAVTAGDATHS